MLLQITTSHTPATDFGYLLHKHPDKFQTFDLSVGKAHIFYPEMSETQATVCLLLEIDAVELVRGGAGKENENFALAHYVNDRPYVASSLMSVAIAKTLSTAMNGKCKEKPELLGVKMPFEVLLTALPAPRGGEFLIRKLFEPLGYVVETERHLLDEKMPAWGYSKYFTVRLKNLNTLQELLSHLYVLIPVLDNQKHYFIGESEIEKLVQKGAGWLSQHPEKEQITRRYLRDLPALSRLALERLQEEEILPETDEEGQPITALQKRKETLHDKRLQTVAQKLVESGAEAIADVGCGEGKLIRILLKYKQFSKILGIDVSYNELLKAKQKLHWDDLPAKQQERIMLSQGSLMYKDNRLHGFDAIAVVEVIEHLEKDRLQAFERVIFEFAQPKTVVLTTPNQEYNTVWESLEAGEMRHTDHRFEWTRAEFQAWAGKVGKTFGYAVEFFGIGEEIENIGAPSQGAVFTKV
jgi:3' terminal RNA ribose 2'-O-methyltransferase Hen1